ncbi:MAG: Arm DNA-binding domain-containing protein [Alistipes indistinctus]
MAQNGEAPICLRITVNGIAVESQIKRSVPPEAWDQNTQSVKGRDRRAQETNECIRMLEIRTLPRFTGTSNSAGPISRPGLL